MTSLEKIRKIRIAKLKALEARGFDCFPRQSKKTHKISEALKDFFKLKIQKKEIVLAGRVISWRGHGGMFFLDIKDESGKIQVLFKKDKLGEKGFKFFQDFFDIGDFVELRGTLIKTKTAEKTLEIHNFKILAKSLRLLPEKWHGLKDEEERLRKRYLDMIANQEVKEIFIKKARYYQAMREFLQGKGFTEVETPASENTTGGADARPFVTHHNALDMDVYLRISVGELWQKRLMVAGFEKTFEIGRIFRNEGMDAEHLQDYTSMEFYWAYADWNDSMKLTEELVKYVAKETFGTLKFKIKNFEIDLSKKWERYDYCETIKKYTGVDIEELLSRDTPRRVSVKAYDSALQKIKTKLHELKVEYENFNNLERGIDNLWKYCRKNIAGPGFVVYLPKIISPLAKESPVRPGYVERYQLILAGSELCNGFSELNDPLDQEERFRAQAELRVAGDEEAQMNDDDFVEALKHGMPPTTGLGISERLFAFLMDKPMRECQIFPLMRPRK